METRDFLSAMIRICSEKVKCADDCPVQFFCTKNYDKNTKDDIEKVEKVVEEWLKDHPVKTRQSEFLKKFPNAAVDYGTIDILPCKFDKTLAEDCDGAHPKKCIECKDVYWSKEVE